MVSASAINPLLKNGVCTGYRLKDENGTIMDVPCDKIIAAMQAGMINITNLEVTPDGKLTTKQKETNQSPKQAKMKRMYELVSKLNEARRVYEQGKDEIMSNKEYDALYDELNDLENELGTVLNDSPTINVGYEVVSNLPKETHNSPMLSLGKTKERDDLKSFLNTHEGVLSWKLDGLTVVLTYSNGELQKAVTRGNGTIGEVVTNNAKTFKNVPRKIGYNGNLVLRGEAVIKYSTFERINSNGEYKNPRNLCSGSVRQLDSSITAARDVNWLCFELVECDNTISNNFDEQLDWLKSLGFEVVEHVVVNSANIEDTVNKFSQTLSSGGFDIPTDGLVLTYRDRAYGNSL